MRTSVLSFGAAVLLTLPNCTGPSSGDDAGDTTGSGGATAGSTARSGGATSGSGGSAGSTHGGTTASGGTTAAGGASATNGGTTATAGVTSTGGSGVGGASTAGGPANPAGTGGTSDPGVTGGTTSTGGTDSSGGSTASGGTTASGGSMASAGTGGGGPPMPYQGPCDLLTDGCAEAYSVTRAMTVSYTGPLFQLGLSADKNAKTLDIGQTPAHTADMTTWSAYCGGTESKCVVSKIYAQIHSGKNDLLPAVWNAPWGPNCSAGGYTCAAKFTIEQATGLPILTTVTAQEYALSGDAFATGVNGGKQAIGLMYNGKPVANNHYCCGVFGITHKYDADDTFGTDFMLALAYGWKDSNGCCIAVNCGASNKYCVGAEEEENNDLFDYGTSPVENALVVTQFDPKANAVITFLNGPQVLSHSPPKASINAGTAIHLGGGGDLSGPDPVLMREALVTNTLLTADKVLALKANAEASYPALKFP